MKKISLIALGLLVPACAALAQLSVQQLRCENLVNPLGLDVATPRFSWQLVSSQRNVQQTAYEIRVGSDVAALSKGKNITWATGKTASPASVWVEYAGAVLQSGQKYWWQVRVWDNKGNASDWSAPAYWQMGLLNAADWKARWIAPGFEEDSTRPSPIFRKEFSGGKKIVSATAYLTARGLYEAHINGRRIGDAYLTPGWTSYNNRLQYQVYDVTDLIVNGKNTISVALGSGWYRGNLGWETQKDIYGKELALLFQLHIAYADGSAATIVSDGSWKSATGSVRSAEIYHGETIDARLEKTGWMNTGYDDRNWAGANVKDYPPGNLVATYNEPIRKHETFQPKQIFKTPKGELVADFGQNLVGWCILKARGKSGDSIVLQHAEVLDKAGNFYLDNMRSAKVTDTYVLRGSGEETFEPHFTFHGFRYVKIKGYPGDLKPEHLTAVALYSDMQPTGSFSTSDPLLNRLQSNIQWGQKGNFLDVPTDCPQRDERMGWTGDAQVFSRTATFNMDAHNFFAKWLRDVAADQMPSGSVPFVIPNVLGPTAGGSTGWADVATIIPWNVWLAYGDKRVLEQQYPSMKAWVDFMYSNSKDYLWNVGFHFGDWLFYSPAPDDRDGRAAVTDKYLIAQCFFAHSTQILLNAAQILGKTGDAAYYAELLKNIKMAFQKEYVTPNGRMVSGTQTAYVLALHFDMLPENLRPQAAQKLAQNVRSYYNHLTTGFLGTPYICHVLTRFGYNDLAYKLLFQKTYPSWLYPVTMGATTIWERWDGLKPDSTFQTPTMNSFNHYAYGAIGDWMYRVIAGLDTEESAPGYRQIHVKPYPGHRLSRAAAELQTPYGLAASRWHTESSDLVMEVEIPANTTATIYIPAFRPEDVTESDRPLTASPDVQPASVENGYVRVKSGSGKYLFRSRGWNKSAWAVHPADYEGKYKMAAAYTVTVSATAGTLYLHNGYERLELDPSPEADAFDASGQSALQFIRDAQGKVAGLKMETTGLISVGNKE